ncbi:MAG: heme exporter protein CcmD [Yoonia sp.]|jgi:heme exporter protein CcmD|nr:heme exporter protein CcmD [Yoonia sp.]
MIPDLGKYALPVLAAYGGSILLYVGLIVLVIRKNRAAKRALNLAEAQVEKKSTALA